MQKGFWICRTCSTYQKLGSRGFWRVNNRVFNNGKSFIPLLFNSPKSYFLKSFLRTLIFLTLVAANLVEKMITHLDSSNSSDPDCIPIEILKNYKPKLSCILVDHFNVCLKEFLFQTDRKSRLVVSVFKTVVERSAAKN